MTWDTVQKAHMLNRYRGCWQHTFPKGVNVYIGDQMCKVKQKPDHIDTIQEYIHTHVLKPVRDILEDPAKTVTHYYMLLDRGGTIAKKLFAHAKRARSGVEPMPEPPAGRFVLPQEGLLTKQWESLIANRELARREVYHLFYRAVMEVYEPPVGKCVVLDGACNRVLTKDDYEHTKDAAFSAVYMTRTLPGNPEQPVQMMSSREILNTPMPSGPHVMRVMCPPQDYTHNINEGDLSAFFHVNKHIRHADSPPDVAPDQIILIDSNDGDTVMIALLHARDRIDPRTFKFNSRVWVLLRGSARNREAYLKKKDAALKAGKAWEDSVIDGRDVYININMLYILIDRDADLQKAHYPQGMFVLLHILGGTDFFGDFTGDEYALFYNMNWEKHVWDTWCKHAERFSHMLMLFYTGASTFGQPNLLRRPFIDEEAMLTFFYQCYSAKYGKEIKSIHDVDKVTTKMLEEYTQHFQKNCVRKDKEPDDKWERRFKMAKKKRVPPQAILIRYVRLALLNVTYWINDYRPGGPEMVDPLELFNGFPYYGFMTDPRDPSRITLSPICSVAKPVPDYYVPHTGKHRRRRHQESDTVPSSQSLQMTQEQLEQKRAERHAKMVRHAEREQRRQEREAKRERRRRREEEDERGGARDDDDDDDDNVKHITVPEQRKRTLKKKRLTPVVETISK